MKCVSIGDGAWNCEIIHNESGRYFKKGMTPITYQVGELKGTGEEVSGICKQIIDRIHKSIPDIPNQVIADVLTEINN
jgi:hypothetical protein